MPFVDTTTNILARQDRFFQSGEPDVFHSAEVGEFGFFFYNDNIGPAPANNSMLWPTAKWIELVMARASEIAVAHDWVTEFSGHPYIGPSGFNWYIYTGDYKIPFIPNSGQAGHYQLGGAYSQNVNFWNDFNNKMNFFLDNVKTFHDNEAIGLPDSDAVENYNQVSGSLTRWKNNVFGGDSFGVSDSHFNSPDLDVIFNPYESGYRLFQEAVPGDWWHAPGEGLDADFRKFFYRLPYSGAVSQQKLTSYQGGRKMFGTYSRFLLPVHGPRNTPFSSIYNVVKSVNFTSGNAPSINPVAGGTAELINQSRAIQQIRQRWSSGVWHGNVFVDNTDNHEFGPIGNTQEITYQIVHSINGVYDTGYRGVAYIPTTNTLFPVSNKLWIHYPSGIRNAVWQSSMSSKFMYGLIPLSTRALCRITTGASGITHKLNERWLNNPPTSIKARYGFTSGDYSKIFYPSKETFYFPYQYAQESSGATMYGRLLGFGTSDGDSTTIGPRMATHYEPGVGNYNSFATYIRHLDSTSITFPGEFTYVPAICDTEADAYGPNTHALFRTGAGIEIIYGYIDIINEVHQRNIDLLRSIGRDAIDYGASAYSLYGGVRLSDTFSSGIDFASYLTNSGIYASDVIVNKIRNNEYTVLMQKPIPNFEKISTWSSFNGTEDYTANINFPSNILTEIPPPSSTHMWVAIKPIEFEKDFVLDEIPLLPIEGSKILVKLVNGRILLPSTTVAYENVYGPVTRTMIDVPVPMSYYVGNYKSYYIDSVTSQVDRFAAFGNEVGFGYIESGISYEPFQQQAFEMKNLDNNPRESLMPFFSNKLYVTTPLGDVSNSGIFAENPYPAIRLPNGYVSGNLLAKTITEVMPFKRFPSNR